MIEDFVIQHHRMEAAAVPVDLDETYRYMGIARSVVLGKDGGIPPELRQMVEACVEQMQGTLKAQSVYTSFPLRLNFRTRLADRVILTARRGSRKGCRSSGLEAWSWRASTWPRIWLNAAG